MTGERECLKRKINSMPDFGHKTPGCAPVISTKLEKCPILSMHPTCPLLCPVLSSRSGCLFY